jgi:hypothetical protein
MSPLELRQKLHAHLDRIPETQLPKLQQYLTTLTDSAKASTGASLLAALPTINTWQGDDFKDCLQSVYDSRSPAQFDNTHNPFN